jgi:hypothetical protein
MKVCAGKAGVGAYMYAPYGTKCATRLAPINREISMICTFFYSALLFNVCSSALLKKHSSEAHM